MSSLKANLLIHPVRLRIITTVSTQRMTAKNISEALPDIPLTSLYRHINLLVEGGILQVVEENQIRGTVERVFILAAPPSLTSEDLSGMTKEDYLQAFNTYLSTLMSDAKLYLDSKPDGVELNLLEDGVELDKVQLHLNDQEYKEMSQQFLDIMLAAAKKEPRPDRRRRILTYLFIPVPT